MTIHMIGTTQNPVSKWNATLKTRTIPLFQPLMKRPCFSKRNMGKRYHVLKMESIMIDVKQTVCDFFTRFPEIHSFIHFHTESNDISNSDVTLLSLSSIAHAPC